MMKNASLIPFMALFLQLCTVALGRITYDGLVLTSIDVTPTKDGYVTFSGGKAGKADDDTATFLSDIKQINDKDEDGKRLFKAKKLTVTQAKDIINKASADGKGKPLFCIHGYNTQPGYHLKSIKDVNKKFNQGKFMLVPVIWPSIGGGTNYGTDRVNGAPGAAKAFKALKRGVDAFPSKSLLCHSMGNYILRNAADQKFRFDNIFMVAADVRYDIFHKKYFNSNDPDREDGLKICRMLTNKKKGKVHTIYNQNDAPLKANAWNPSIWVYRLGSSGFNSRPATSGWVEDNRLVHDECKGCLKNFNAGAQVPWISNWAEHSYQFWDFCIKYYQDNHY